MSGRITVIPLSVRSTGDSRAASERHAAILGHKGSSRCSPKVGPLGDIDIETCHECGGTMNVIACIEDPVIIEKILTHLDENVPVTEAIRLPDCRAIMVENKPYELAPGYLAF